MAGASPIEWTEQTWNPVVGCSIVSPGCTNCYAMKMAARIEAMNAAVIDYSRIAKQYDGTTRRVNGNAIWTGKLALAGDNILLQPLKRKKPTVYFVNSMGDLFHEDCPDEWIDKVFAVMALSPQHTFQVLTKRAKRMREYCTDMFTPTRLVAAALNLPMGQIFSATWPLPNVWLGVSTERQQEADERIPELLATPAAVRFISAEPLLGPITLTNITIHLAPGSSMTRNALYARDSLNLGSEERRLDWVIVGGESGREARAMHPDWARSLRDQCSAAGVRFFFKQWGEYRASVEFPDVNDESVSHEAWRRLLADQALTRVDGPGASVAFMRRVGKKAAGRLLDGVLHDAMPEIAR